MSLRARILSKVSITQNFPASALKAMDLLQNPDANMAEIVQTINYDPGLTSNVLKLANSSMFGLTRSIGSLRDSIVRLGTENIFRLITTSVMNSAMNKPLEGYGYSSGEFWEHSIAVATCAENLAELLDIQILNLPFTAGLLHDVGKMLLSNYIQRYADRFEEEIETGDAMEDIEQKLLTIDHAEVGSLLLESWNLPESLVNTVRWHHEPDQCNNPIGGVLHIADYLCITEDIGPEKRVGNISVYEEYFEKLNITDDIKAECVERSQASFENIIDVFSPK